MADYNSKSHMVIHYLTKNPVIELIELFTLWQSAICLSAVFSMDWSMKKPADLAIQLQVWGHLVVKL